MHGRDSFMNKRPKPGESEEDILAQEREFKESIRKVDCLPPAAKVIKSYKNGNEKTSMPNQPEDMETESKPDYIPKGGDIRDREHEIEHPQEEVLFNIKEREFDSSKLKEFTGTRTLPQIVPASSSMGEQNFRSKRAGKSLFARTFDSANAGKESRAPSSTNKIRIEGDNAKKEEVGEKLHSLLAGMKEEEILSAQRELLSKLDPQLVQFIKSRSQSKIPIVPTTSSKTQESQSVSKMEIDSVESKIDISELPINPQEVSTFPRMTTIEPEKLAWAGIIKEESKNSSIEDIGNSQSQSSSDGVEGKNARFDFQGNYIDTTESETLNKGLHCHGEEMERAGYSLEELLILMGSVNPGQRTLSMDTIANIYEKAHTGIYDGCFDKSLFEVINELHFMHAVRVALDHKDSTSVNAALKCLSAIIFPNHEEICLDVIYLWPEAEPHPWLLTNSLDINTIGKDDKDFEILRNDILQFLIQRTDLLVRIGFFFRDKPDILNEQGVIGILKILIRIARHSPNLLVESSDILNYLVNNHVSANWRLVGTRPPSLRGVPLSLAFKVIRILADSSARNAEILYRKYEFFPALMSYLAYFEWNEQSHILDYEELILECFKVWMAFLRHGLAINEYTSFFPILIQFLQYYECATSFSSFDLNHASHLFTLLRRVLQVSERDDIDLEDLHSHWPLVKSGAEFVSNFIRKMLSKILSDENVAPKMDLCLLSVTQGLSFLICASQYEELNFEYLNASINTYLKSISYLSNTKLLTKHSVMLHSEGMEVKRYPVNMSTVGVFLLNGKLNPMMMSGSPYHFLTVLMKYTKKVNQFPQELILNDNVKNYVLEICKKSNSSENCKFFVRFEIAFIDEVLDIYDSGKEKFCIAYKMLSQVPVCCSEKHIRFLEKVFYCCAEDEELLCGLHRLYSKSLKKINSPMSSDSSTSERKVRFEESAISREKQIDDTLLFAQWTQKLTKRYWIFEPLDDMYKNATQINGYVENNLKLLEKQSRIFLQFALQCIQNFSDTLITDIQDLVMVYSRICQIFVLGDPRIYIDEVNTPSLRALLNALMNCSVMSSNHSDLVFSQLKPTAEFSTSFYDIYSDLVREFHDNSYFNELFVSFLLLPLRTAEDSRIKKIFWTAEHINCIRLCSENIDVPLSWFTSQVETDGEILQLYWKLYQSRKITKIRNPFLFEIVKFHLLSQNDKMGESLREEFTKLQL